MHTRPSGHGIPALAALVGLLLGCSDPKSSSTSGPNGGPVSTSRMTLDLRVEAVDAVTAVVRANLNDGQTPRTSFRLDGGDFLRACVAGVCRTMADNDSVFSPDYIARFDYQPGVDYVVTFNRQQARNAPDSRVSLPPAFTIVTPVDGQQVSDGETVLVAWTPTGLPARVTLGYEAECTFASGPAGFSSGLLGRDPDGDGVEMVDIDEMVDFAGSISASAITRCSIDLIVRHEVEGHIDPAFGDGVAMGIVSRDVNLDYRPGQD